MSNCLIFALRKWFKEGGYVIIRKSRFGFWPHFIWCRDLKDAEIEHYVPIVGKLDKGPVQKFLFKGYVKNHDQP